MEYEIDQNIHYMHENKPTSAPVSTTFMIEHKNDDLADVKLQGRSSVLFMDKIYKTANKSGEYYLTVDGIFFVDEVFESKDELLEHLRK